jgi:hypothetical protein
MIALQHFRGESAPISPAAFTLRDGKIVGILDAGVEAGRARAKVEDEAAGAGEGDGEPYVSGMAVKGEHGLDLVIVAVGDDFSPVAAAIQSFFLQMLNKYLPEPEFSGRFEVVLPETTPEGVWRQMPALEQHLQAAVKRPGVTTRSGRPVTISFHKKAR